MQIIIPMSGFGERFRRAGYRLPKPLIEVEGKPIVGHVLDLFPDERDVLFICNQDHLGQPEYRMTATLNRLCPTGKICGIDPHKHGPVHAVLAAAEHIRPDEPVIVSYCDFAGVWNYEAFKQMIEHTRCDGALLAYTGFHPHMLRSHAYGYARMQGEQVTAIQEKQPYTDQPMQEYALAGAYYFRTGTMMLEAFRALELRHNLRINGEHYISLAYRQLLERQADIRVFTMAYFMQWGTPEDLQEYLHFSAMFRAQMKIGQRTQHPGAIVMPMAGAGQRFVDAGYRQPKPLIPVSGRPMALQALRDLPEAPRTVSVLRRDLPDLAHLQQELQAAIPALETVMLDRLTDGQAITAQAGLKGMSDDTMVTFGACDHGMLYDAAALNRLLADPTIDVIVWGMRGHPQAAYKPQAYSWINADATGNIGSVSVKVPLNDPVTDPTVVGTFTFRRVGDCHRAIAHMIDRKARVHGEFYIDMAINDAIAMGLRCHLFEIDHYLGWGTPDELRTFAYWQRCFDRWPMHPYALANDPDVINPADTVSIESSAA